MKIDIVNDLTKYFRPVRNVKSKPFIPFDLGGSMRALSISSRVVWAATGEVSCTLVQLGTSLRLGAERIVNWLVVLLRPVTGAVQVMRVEVDASAGRE